MKKNNKKREEQGKVLIRLLSYAKPHVNLILLAFMFLFLTTIGDVLGPILVKIFIDDYLTSRDIQFEPLFVLAASYLGIQIANVVFSYLQLLKFQEIALRIIHAIRVDIFSKVEELGLKYFDRTHAGGIVSRVTNDTEAIKDLFVTVLSTFIQSGFLMVGILIAMFLLNYKLAIFCLFILPVLFLIMKTYKKKSTVFYQNMRERLSQLNAKLNESLQGMSIIQLFRQEQRLRKEFQEINEQHYLAGKNNIHIESLFLRPAIDLVYVGSIILVLSFFGIRSFNSPIEIGVLYAFVNYLDRFFEPVNNLMSNLSFYQQAIVSASRVFKLMDEKELEPSQRNERYTIDYGEIVFQNVSFSYDGKKKVLKNITFTAKPGQMVALVGHTGSGKSTISNLLMRFYEFEQGEIWIDGKSIRDFHKEELRKKIGLVLQDPFLFYGTIKDNIRLYNNDITDLEVEKAAQFVQAHTFIKKLDGEYNHTVVERGSTFSSGQRQLIAFARTIASNPKILILDEATANIDTETEEFIQIALDKMRKGRTTIAIAHRLSTIQNADQILVLHQGKIVERGNHQELLALKGLYYKMYLLQNGMTHKLENAMG